MRALVACARRRSLACARPTLHPRPDCPASTTRTSGASRPLLCAATFRSASAAALVTPPPSAAGEDSEHSQHQGYAGLFAYPFGLSSADALVSEYRSCVDAKSASAALRALQQHLETEAHALELDEHLQGKCAHDQRSNATYIDLASRVDILHAQVTQLQDTMLMERFDKTFVLYPPPPPAAAETADSATASASVPLADGIRFESHWTTHRHTLRQELAPCEHHARILATPFRVVTHEDGTVGSVDLEPIRLLETTDPQNSHVDREALEEIRQLYGGSSVTPREFVWFVSFVSSHPSDYAFDAVTVQLLP